MISFLQIKYHLEVQYYEEKKYAAGWVKQPTDSIQFSTYSSTKICAVVHLLHRGSSINLKPVRDFCGMIWICRYQKGLISFSLLWLVCDRRRLIIPRYTKKKELTFIRVKALNLNKNYKNK